MLFVFSPAFALEGLSVVGEAGKSVINENRAASVRDMKVGDPRHRHGGAIVSGAAPKEVRIRIQYRVPQVKPRLAAIAILGASHAIGPLGASSWSSWTPLGPPKGNHHDAPGASS